MFDDTSPREMSELRVVVAPSPLSSVQLLGETSTVCPQHQPTESQRKARRERAAAIGTSLGDDYNTGSDFVCCGAR